MTDHAAHVMFEEHLSIRVISRGVSTRLSAGSELKYWGCIEIVENKMETTIWLPFSFPLVPV